MTRRRVCTVLHMVNSVIYTAVIGWQEVIIININGSLLGGVVCIFFPARVSGDWFLAGEAVVEGRCGQFEEALNCRGPLTKANWCGCRLDSSGWRGGCITSYKEAQQAEQGNNC